MKSIYSILFSLIITQSFGLTLRGPTSADQWFTVSAASVETVVVDGETSTDTLQDLNRTTHTGASYSSGMQLSVEDNYPTVFGATFTSLDPSVATVDSYGRVTRVSDGTARILITADKHPRITKRYDCDVALAESAALVTYPSYLAGTLGAEITDAVDDRLDGTDDKEIYSAINNWTGAYTRNASCWLSGVNLTCVSPYNSMYVVSNLTSRIGLTAITPLHAIGCHHAIISNGVTVRFVDSNSSTVTRTIVSSSQIGATDIQIYTLSSVLPETVTCAKVLPSGWEDYLPGISHRRIPVISIDQEQHVCVRDIGQDFSASTIVGCYAPLDATPNRLESYEALTYGDSGYPCFFVIDDAPVLICCWHYGPLGSGANVAYYASDINTAISGSGYSLTEATLTGFTDFGI